MHGKGQLGCRGWAGEYVVKVAPRAMATTCTTRVKKRETHKSVRKRERDKNIKKRETDKSVNQR